MKPAFVKGASAALTLLTVYFIVVSLVSGWNFAKGQFQQFWPFVISLAVGFGIQYGLYNYLKNGMKKKHAASGQVLAVSGTTSTAAMISCCAHYLVNFLPILGTIGIITVISQYQLQFFWVGLMFNLAGVGYMLYQVRKFNKMP